MPALDDLVRQDAPSASTDQLEEIVSLSSQAQALASEVEEAEERLAVLKRRLLHLTRSELPEKMDRAGISSLDIAARGNFAAFTVKVHSTYHASIAASWDAERRRLALDWLEAHGCGTLIKTEVWVAFEREDRDAALMFLEEINRRGLRAAAKESVHSATLSSWLREAVEAGDTPPLDLLGAHVGREARIKVSSQ